jgi:hypothetical protein
MSKTKENTPDKVNKLGEYFTLTAVDANKANAFAAAILNQHTQLQQAGCENIQAVYILSTAGSRQQICQNAKTARDALETDLKRALEKTLKTDNNINYFYQVISGRFEGLFGMADAHSKHAAQATDPFVYYECGGSSCQMAFKSNAQCAGKYKEAIYDVPREPTAQPVPVTP